MRGNVPSLGDFFDEEPPITTSLDDALTEVAYLDDFTPSVPIPLGLLPRSPDGTFQLFPGAFETEAQSYCLHAGTYGPESGDGYLLAPLAGPRAPIVQSLLRRSTVHPEIDQRDIQVLIWAIIARTKVSDMPPAFQRTAGMLLTTDEIRALNDGALGLVPEPILREAMSKLSPYAREVFQAESRLRQMMYSGTATYDELERVAVLAGT